MSPIYWTSTVSCSPHSCELALKGWTTLATNVGRQLKTGGHFARIAALLRLAFKSLLLLVKLPPNQRKICLQASRLKPGYLMTAFSRQVQGAYSTSAPRFTPRLRLECWVSSSGLFLFLES